MRNPNRIPEFLYELQTVWQKYPDLRFGQLIEDCFALTGNHLDSLYYMEDDKMLEIIKIFGGK